MKKLWIACLSMLIVLGLMGCGTDNGKAEEKTPPAKTVAQAPRIMDTFVESYDFTGKNMTVICTSGGSDIGSSADYLAKLTKGKANWKPGKLFSPQAGTDEIKAWYNGLGF